MSTVMDHKQILEPIQELFELSRETLILQGIPEERLDYSSHTLFDNFEMGDNEIIHLDEKLTIRENKEDGEYRVFIFEEKNADPTLVAKVNIDFHPEMKVPVGRSVKENYDIVNTIQTRITDLKELRKESLAVAPKEVQKEVNKRRSKNRPH